MLNNLRSRNTILSLPDSKTYAHSATWYHHHYLRLDLEVEENAGRHLGLYPTALIWAEQNG